ncbi:MAG TPA: TatD family hydrolase [Bryobacteraceae bacterium]|nr:TatD family hydrolase [Bryobacteraceae bacterium]HOQ45769.1 TatD family hydrolase [Bryobacteraceae bacterium]HPQ14105.1 TatD family hydrolase [Bryobacteraceae bacterium]HPU71504.1 TatD family hydrolase [Bryobacteraceae bacterium]
MLADSHCHLDDPQFDADRDAVIERARAAGVERLLAVGTGSGPPDLEAGIRIAERWPHIWATVGVHPHDAAKAVPETFERVRELLEHPRVVAAGEIGLDYHYDFSPRHVQREVFARQVEIARAAGKPIIIHTREAWADTLSVLGPGPHRGIFHCFSGGPEEAKQALELGFYISFSGVVTFPKAARVQEAVRIVPADRLLVETDAPYLAPVPRRGKRNEPAFVVETARKVAELRGETFEQVASVTWKNFARVLGLEC